MLVVEDGRLLRECLCAQLAAHGMVVDQAWDLQSLLVSVDRQRPDVILVGVGNEDSATLVQISLDIDRSTKVVVFDLSVDREPEIISAAEAGVAGLHLRSESFEHLLKLVENAGQGQAQCSPEVSAILMKRVYAFAAQPNPDSTTDVLTPRETEILALIEQGLSNQQIATRLSLTLHTVKNHVHSVLTKLGVGSRAEAVSVLRATKFGNPPAN